MDLDELDNENQVLLEFSFHTSDNTVLSDTSKAAIDNTSVYITLPAGTDRSALVPRFDLRGKGLQVNGVWQISGQTAQNFTKPVIYDLIRADDSRIQYTITAGYGNAGDTQLYSFSFRSDLNAGISSTVYGVFDNNSITMNFPFESTVGKMMPSFDVPSGAVVSYNGVVLVSDSSPLINPSDGGILKVDFTDGSSRVYSFKTVVEDQDFVYVSTSGSAGASGSQMNPLDTLDEAINLAISKNIPEIRMAAGTYTLGVNLEINQNITIRGGYNSLDWSNRWYESPDARNNASYRTEILTSSSGSGTTTEPLGTLIYRGSGVGNSSRLEGVVVQAGSGGNFTCALSVLDGAKPVIVFSDLLGASTLYGAGAFVRGSSPSFFSSILKSGAMGVGSGGIGLLVGENSSPQVVSCYISSYDASVPEEGSGLQLDGSGAGGVYYNNFIEGQGSTQGAAVKLSTSGGTFINNIFSNGSVMPNNFCFSEDVSGARPALLQNNNFSSLNISVPLYQRDGSVYITDSKGINALGYAGSSGNTGFRFQSFGSYLSDYYSQMFPPAIVYKGATPPVNWTRDLYNVSRTSSATSKWSMGALELDYTPLGEDAVIVNDTVSDYYDGYWSSLDIREAITLVNTWPKTTVIVYTGSFTTIINDPLIVTSDLYFKGAAGDTIFDGSASSSLFIIDDGDSGNDLDVYFQNVVFQNANSSSGNGGAILSHENLYLYDCMFLNNQALEGGAIDQTGGNVFLANTVFEQNFVTNGNGGALHLKDSSLNVINLVFAGNAVNGPMASYGSAIYLDNSPAAILFSSFLNNQNFAGGSATVYSTGSFLSVLNSIFYVNSGTPYFDLEVSGGTPGIKGSLVETTAYVSVPDQVSDANPLVLSTATPAGSDLVWKTSIDNFELQSGSPAVNWGFSYDYPDWPDADGDGNTTEPFPYDILKNDRIRNGLPDAGAYESGY